LVSGPVMAALLCLSHLCCFYERQRRLTLDFLWRHGHFDWRMAADNPRLDLDLFPEFNDWVWRDITTLLPYCMYEARLHSALK
jgi:hypothetical protein